MLRTIIVIALAGFALLACASTRAADLPAKPKVVHVAKAKPKSVTSPTPSASQPVAPAPKAKKKKVRHWYTPWRK